ncbi:MAG: hypothetical protein HYT08_03445 [Candidatus Levybacteria bacterium]|nr:hypothetical protein [Candidatus Levybacteria bacterium]
MVTEAQRNRNLARELASKMMKQDQREIDSLLREPASQIKTMIAQRVNEAVQLDCFPEEEVFILTQGFQVINGTSVTKPDFYKEETERPFVSQDGILYICPDIVEPSRGKVINWSKKREATAREYIQHSSAVLTRLSDAIDWRLNPPNPYFMD